MCVSPNLPTYPSPPYPPFCFVNFSLNSKESKNTPTNCVPVNTSILVCLLSKRLRICADDVDGDNYWLDVHPCDCFPTVCLLTQRLLPAWCWSSLQLPGLWITVCSVVRWLRGPADAPISHRCRQHIKGIPCLSVVALVLVCWASLSSPDCTNPLPQIPTSPTLLSWAPSISGQEVPKRIAHTFRASLCQEFPQVFQAVVSLTSVFYFWPMHNSHFNFIYLFISGCVGSSFLCEGFL